VDPRIAERNMNDIEKVAFVLHLKSTKITGIQKCTKKNVVNGQTPRAPYDAMEIFQTVMNPSEVYQKPGQI